MSSYLNKLGANFEHSADNTYNHPAAHAGGFAGGEQTSTGRGNESSFVASGNDNAYSSSGNENAYGSTLNNEGSSGIDNTFGSEGITRDSNRGSTTDDFASTIDRSFNNVGTGSGTTQHTPTEPATYGVTGNGDPIAPVRDGNPGYTSESASGAFGGGRYGAASERTEGYGAGGYGSSQSGTDHTTYGGNALGVGAAAGTGAAGYGAYEATRGRTGAKAHLHGSDSPTTGYGQNNSSGSRGYDDTSSGAGAGAVAQDKNLTSGNAKVDNFVSDKFNENTDKDGFTNLTGDKEPAGVLTGRVKADGDPVVETTKQRSERDGQGRELDSYGKPYDL